MLGLYLLHASSHSSLSQAKYFIMNESLKNKLSNSYVEMISHPFESFILDYLVFPLKNLDGVRTLKIFFNHQIIFMLPFDIITKKFIKIINNNCYLTIDHSLIIQQGNSHDPTKNIKEITNNFLNIFYPQLSNIVLCLESNDKFNYDIYYKKIFYDSDLCKVILKNSFINTINQYQKINFDSNKILVNVNTSSFGFYIKLFDKLTNIKLIINENIDDNVLLEYSEENIIYNNLLIHKKNIFARNKTVLLNKKFPRDVTNIIKNFSDNYEYLYHINFNKIQSITTDVVINFGRLPNNPEIIIKTENDIYKGQIYFVNKNMIMQEGGCITLRYAT